jgi:benzoylformate decarboxylase
VPSVRAVVYDLLRELGMSTLFGNPGSTELPFLREFPADFRYVLGLSEAAVVGMADGFAQSTGRAAFVSLHSASGPGNAMGAVVNAYHNRAPLVIMSGQQDRRHLAIEPYLFARSAEFVRPYVKWAAEPASPGDVPAALQRAWAQAMHQPPGPAFVSVPMDDWDAPARPLPRREVSRRQGADPADVERLAGRLRAAARPGLVVGEGVDRSGAWPQAVALAERLGTPVWAAPQAARAGFPEDHALFAGHLAPGVATLTAQLAGHDLVLVIGAPVFAVLAYEPQRQPLPDLVMLTDDVAEASRAPVTAAVVADVRLALCQLLEKVPEPLSGPARPSVPPARQPPPRVPEASPISAGYLMQTLGELLPPDAVLVEESPSNRAEMRRHVRIRRPAGFYASASGGLGFALPAAVGIKLADPARTVVCLTGDGSALYAVQALWTAAQHDLAIAVVVVGNGSYQILASFAKFAGLGQVPGLELCGLDFAAIAAGFGCRASSVTEAADLPGALAAALADDRPHVLHVTIDRAVPGLLG